jgi:hypothetical protein
MKAVNHPEEFNMPFLGEKLINIFLTPREFHIKKPVN